MTWKDFKEQCQDSWDDMDVLGLGFWGTVGAIIGLALFALILGLVML